MSDTHLGHIEKKEWHDILHFDKRFRSEKM